MEHMKRKCGFCNSERTQIFRRIKQKDFTLKCNSCGQSYEIYAINQKHR